MRRWGTLSDRFCSGQRGRVTTRFRTLQFSGSIWRATLLTQPGPSVCIIEVTRKAGRRQGGDREHGRLHARHAGRAARDTVEGTA